MLQRLCKTRGVTRVMSPIECPAPYYDGSMKMVMSTRNARRTLQQRPAEAAVRNMRSRGRGTGEGHIIDR